MQLNAAPRRLFPRAAAGGARKNRMGRRASFHAGSQNGTEPKHRIAVYCEERNPSGETDGWTIPTMEMETMAKSTLFAAAAAAAMLAFAPVPADAQRMKGGEGQQMEIQPGAGGGGDGQMGGRGSAGGETGLRTGGAGERKFEGEGRARGEESLRSEKFKEGKFRGEDKEGERKFRDDEGRKFSGKFRDDDEGRKWRWRHGKREVWRGGHWVVVVGAPGYGLAIDRCHFHKWPALYPPHRSVRCDHWHGWHRSIAVVD
jgi:hypothetical protein